LLGDFCRNPLTGFSIIRKEVIEVEKGFAASMPFYRTPIIKNNNGSLAVRENDKAFAIFIVRPKQSHRREQDES